MIEQRAAFTGFAKPYFRVLDTHFRLPRAVSVSYTPDQLAGLYHFPVNLAGPDMTIGIIELGGGYSPTDVQAAFSSWHMPMPHLTDVSVLGAKNSPGNDADVEVLLDIQIAAALYSYSTNRVANVRTYFAPNSDAGFAMAVAQAAHDGCATISISWGSAEENWGQSVCNNFDAVCKAAMLSGSTIFAASGDNLSDDGVGSGIHVDFPAASPNVVGCGGTAKLNSSETVWNEGGGGTGGGFSTFFRSQPWQIGAPGAQGRMVPDVAGDAAPSTGWRVYANGRWIVVGGTSAVAPMYAGLFAALASAAGKKLGNVLPILWQNPAAFTDITVGNNGKWRALAGPDPCTGLGVPIGTALQAIFAPTPLPTGVAVPKVVGLTWLSAKLALTSVNLVISPSSVPDANAIVASQSPPVGTMVPAGSTVSVSLTPAPPPTQTYKMTVQSASPISVVGQP